MLGLTALMALGCAMPAPELQEHERAQPLRVCADPDNLPYSNRAGEGFENRIAALVADELKRPLVFAWIPQWRAVVRKTLGSGECDSLVGVPVGLERVITTRPYYRSSYVIVTRVDDPAPLRSFADPRLTELRIGVQLVGNDMAATPPGEALARLGAVQHVAGYPLYGTSPAAARMLQALAAQQLDAALLWGPQAGYFALRSAVPLQLSDAKAPDAAKAPFEFSIAMAVRPQDGALRDALDAAIEHRRAEIDAVLTEFGVPRSTGRSAS